MAGNMDDIFLKDERPAPETELCRVPVLSTRKAGVKIQNCSPSFSSNRQYLYHHHHTDVELKWQEQFNILLYIYVCVCVCVYIL